MARSILGVPLCRCARAAVSGPGSKWLGRLPESTLKGKSRQGYSEYGGLDSSNVLVPLSSLSSISEQILTATWRGLALFAQEFYHAPLP